MYTKSPSRAVQTSRDWQQGRRQRPWGGDRRGKQDADNDGVGNIGERSEISTKGHDSWQEQNRQERLRGQQRGGSGRSTWGEVQVKGDGQPSGEENPAGESSRVGGKERGHEAYIVAGESSGVGAKRGL